jgi:hypothetical protein
MEHLVFVLGVWPVLILVSSQRGLLRFSTNIKMVFFTESLDININFSVFWVPLYKILSLLGLVVSLLASNNDVVPSLTSNQLEIIILLGLKTRLLQIYFLLNSVS